MLSRRNIRVKVMQTLYGLESVDQAKAGEPQKIFDKKIQDAQELLTYLAMFLTEIALYAESYAIRKSQKHLPTQSDLEVSTKVAGNTIVWDIRENNSFKAATEKFKTKYQVDGEMVKKYFLKLIESEDYQQYTNTPGRDKKSDKHILEIILENQMLQNEDFISDGEEKFIHWDDDLETAIHLLKAVLSKPASADFLELPGADKLAFGRDLLQTVLDKNGFCLDLIKPKLKNWEAERIALLDMILLKMGVCELLYFETIPTKVTLNEYIDIAKEYSTEKSGNFVNGILDNIYKDLATQNKIQKKSFNNSVN